MKKTEKTFDCVEMMHAGALRIYEEMKNMTKEQRLAYWRQKDEEARKKYPQMREATPVNSATE
jgi:hypothetical protein